MFFSACRGIVGPNAGGMTDESPLRTRNPGVCPTLPSRNLQARGAGVFACQPVARLAFPLALVVVLAQISCTRQAAVPAVQRLAVLRFENLSSEPAADWVGRAFEEILIAEEVAPPPLKDVPVPDRIRVPRVLKRGEKIPDNWWEECE